MPLPHGRGKGCPQNLGTLSCPTAAPRRAGDWQAGQKVEVHPRTSHCHWTENTKAGRPRDLSGVTCSPALPTPGPRGTAFLELPGAAPLLWGAWGPWMAGSLGPGLPHVCQLDKGPHQSGFLIGPAAFPKGGLFTGWEPHSQAVRGIPGGGGHGLHLCWV